MKRPIFLDDAETMDIVEIEHRVVPASRESLMKFPKAELQRYAKGLGLTPSGLKVEIVDRLMNPGRATLCASLGD